MGLRNRIKEKLKERLQDIRALVNVIHDEAKHPGRPQPHMAARNPLYGGQEESPETAPKPSESSTPEKSAAPSPPQADDGDFWYLRGDDEGWSDLNPGKEEGS